MKLSIIVPMYNVEKYIEKCLKSLLNQDLSRDDYEILIINDGSKDRSKHIVNEYMKNNKNIRMINQKNGGQSKARNTGIDNAKGEYLFFVDSDDYIEDYTLQSIVNKAINNKLEMLFFNINIISNDTNWLCYPESEYNCKIMSGIDFFTLMNVNNGPWGYLISKKFLDENNIRFIEGKFCEDGMFLIDCIFVAKKVLLLEKHIYNYVRREQSTTTKKDNEHKLKMIYDYLFAVKHLDEYYKKAANKGYDKKFLEKLEDRRNSYIFFMQGRILKTDIKIKEINSILGELKKIKCFKYKRISKKYYKGIKITMLHNIFNNEILFLLLNKVSLKRFV